MDREFPPLTTAERWNRTTSVFIYSEIDNRCQPVILALVSLWYPWWESNPQNRDFKSRMYATSITRAKY